MNLKNTNKIKFSLIFSFIPLMFSCVSYTGSAKDNYLNDFYLEIKQTVYGAYKQYTFVLEKNELYIFENNLSKDGTIKRKKVYSKKIKNKEIICDIENKSEKLFDLNSEYINARIDGLHWEINFIKGNKNKKIIIENKSVPEVLVLFETINSTIPNNKPQLHKP